jgi:hypothetical protein
MSQHSNWEKAHDGHDFFNAELLKNFLINEHEIEAVVINKQISGYNFGRYEIHVMKENLEKAIELIASIAK